MSIRALGCLVRRMILQDHSEVLLIIFNVDVRNIKHIDKYTETPFLIYTVHGFIISFNERMHTFLKIENMLIQNYAKGDNPKTPKIPKCTNENCK